MTYCTQQNLVDRFGEDAITALSDKSGAGVIDAGVVAQAIADADDQINRKLRGRYTVPISPAPAELVGIACDIAFWNLYRGTVAPEDVAIRHSAAIAELRDYATGRNVLDIGDDGDASNDANPQRPAVIGGTQVFSATLLDQLL